MHFFKYLYLFRWLKYSSRGMGSSTHSINRASVRHFACTKMRFFKGREPSTHRYLAFTKPLFYLLEAWQWNSSRVMRLLAEEYMASDVQHFVILEAWKSDSCHVVKSSNQANWLHVNHCSKFWLLQKVILQIVKRTSCNGYLTYIEIHLSIIAAWKKFP
jgi:hypothetical protein